MGMGPPHILVRIIFLIHCWVMLRQRRESVERGTDSLAGTTPGERNTGGDDEQGGKERETEEEGGGGEEEGGGRGRGRRRT